MYANSLFVSSVRAVRAAILASAAWSAFAQEPAVPGVPALRPLSAEAAPTRPASAPKKPAATPPASLTLLTGAMGVQHSARDGLGRLVFTTGATFTTNEAQRSATTAARSVQRGLANACGTQCKPEKMAPPKVLPSGQLEFELVFRPLYQHLTQAQYVAALQSQPFNLTPAQINVPAPGPAESTPANETATR